MAHQFLIRREMSQFFFFRNGLLCYERLRIWAVKTLGVSVGTKIHVPARRYGLDWNNLEVEEAKWLNRLVPTGTPQDVTDYVSWVDDCGMQDNIRAFKLLFDMQRVVRFRLPAQGYICGIQQILKSIWRKLSKLRTLSIDHYVRFTKTNDISTFFFGRSYFTFFCIFSIRSLRKSRGSRTSYGFSETDVSYKATKPPTKCFFKT